MKKTTLSEILEKAGNDATYREQFYRRFLEENVYVLIQKESNGKEIGSTSDLKKRPIVVFPNQVIPVFTEITRIFEQESIRNEVTPVPINGREFLKMAQTSAVVVNPFSAIYKELIPLEISEMLSGSMFDKQANRAKTKQTMAVQIGQPSVYPSELVDCLIELFTAQPEVKAAHLGWIYNPAVGDPPHYIFALECATKDMKRITDQAALASQPFMKADQFVDFMQLEKGADISTYFYEHTVPFYTSN